MTKQEKNEVIEVLKGKFTQYNNFYVTDTESLTVAQVTKLRSYCFDKQVEMRVAKNTLIKKALESLDTEKYAGVYDSLHNVTALLFSENPKEPALILSGFRKESKGEKPELKAAFINGDVFVGDNQLKALTQIKTRNELIGEVIGLLMSPIQRVLGALQNKDAARAESAAPVEDAAPVAEATAPAAPAEPTAPAATVAAPGVEANPPAAPSVESPVVPPLAETEKPAADVTAPVAEAENAIIEATPTTTTEAKEELLGEAIAPTADIATPVVETPAPVAEATKPVADDAAPEANASEKE